MLVVKIEPTNRHNIPAVAIYRQRYQNCRPSSLQSSSKNVSIFYEKHEQNICRNTGAKVNRGAGYGLEVPCVYHLYGPTVYVDKMKELVKSLLADGHYNLCNSSMIIGAFKLIGVVDGCSWR